MEEAYVAEAKKVAPKAVDVSECKKENARLTKELKDATTHTKELEDMRTALVNALEDGQLFETRLRDNLAMFNAVAASIPAGLLVEDANGDIFTVNARFCDIFGAGMAPDALIGASCAKQAQVCKTRLAEPEQFVRRIEELTAARKPDVEELRFADGRDIRRDYIPISALDGTFIGHLWLYRDITEERLAAEKIRAAAVQQTAAAELGRIALTSDDISAIVQRTVSAVAAALNANHVRLIEHDIHGTNFVMRAGYGWPEPPGTVISSDDISSAEGFAIASGASLLVEDFEADKRFTRDRQLRNAAIRSGMCALIRGPQGGTYGTIGVHSAAPKDFTAEDLRYLETMANIVGVAIERQSSRERVRDLDSLKNKFIQTVSHQFRTPLNAVRWNLEALLSDELGKLKPEQKEFIRLTYDANNAVILRIHDLLTALDIEEGRAPLSKETLSFESLWSTVMADWAKRLALKQIALSYVPPAEPLPAITADTEKIRLILEKLTDNALSYTPENGKVDVTLSGRNGHLVMEITDNGIGIPKAEQGRIFERFYRATNASVTKTDSSGLGLSIARFFARQHDGDITFVSREGKGSTFRLELPLR
jgi:PAS domain S-box-containing protein